MRYGIIWTGTDDASAVRVADGNVYCECYRNGAALICYDHYGTMDEAIRAAAEHNADAIRNGWDSRYAAAALPADITCA